MSGLKTQNRRSSAGDPLSDLLDDTDMKRSAARARPRVQYAPSSSSGNVWWIATAASLIWIAAVLAFSWARYALPGDPRSIVDAAKSRMEVSDWLMIVAAIVGPVLLIWVIAWLVRRSMELRDESRRLAKAAILLADAAETAERRAELMLPAPDSLGGELIAQGPGHFHREIERATHAMSALQTQMSSMEDALSKQATAMDNAADRTAARAKAISDETAAAGLLATVPALSSDRQSSTLVLDTDADEALEIAPDLVVTPSTGSAGDSAIAVDLAFEPDAPSDAEGLRAGLAAVAKGAGWIKLIPDASNEAAAPASSGRPQTQARSPLESIREDVQAIKAPADDGRIDPFDDLGPSAPKAAAGAALGAGVAMGFGATRDDEDVSGVRLDAPLAADHELEPMPPSLPKSDPKSGSSDSKQDFEFMARALDWKKFVRAANFPENETDTATLDALYDVLTDPEAAALLQSSEDILATLADLDLYMEDFVPEMSPVLSWRGHLEGKPGVQGMDAPIEQSRISAKLHSDANFRKLSERFSERYQVVLKRLFNEAADDRLALELADSRTGRAYILVAGCLDKL